MTYYAVEGTDNLYDTPKEAIEAEGNLNFPVVVNRLKTKQASIDPINDILSPLIEDLDEEYGDIDGDGTVPSKKMIDAAKRFSNTILKEYVVKACEIVETKKYTYESGKSGNWRLPTVDELHEAFDYKNGRPKVDGFTPYYYWSSTPYSHNMNGVWIVHFHRGYAYNGNKLSTYCVRCVRENKKGKLKWSESTKNRMTLSEAKKYCEELNNEKSNLRLPTIEELRNAFDYECGKPKIDGFTSNGYWSSTTHVHHTDYAWIVYFHTGNTDYNGKSFTYYVRCVKEIEKGKLEWSRPSKDEMTWSEAKKYCERLSNEK